MIHDEKPLLRGCHSGPGPGPVWSSGPVPVGLVPVGLVPVGPVPVGPVPVGPVQVGPVPGGPNTNPTRLLFQKVTFYRLPGQRPVYS